MKKIYELIKTWGDLIILAPLTLIILLILTTCIHLIDPTATVLDIGTLQLLAMNVLIYTLINGLGYLFFRLNLGYDPFFNGWLLSLSTAKRAIIHIGLYVFQILLAAFLIARNL